jgi:hypothetical protein
MSASYLENDTLFAYETEIQLAEAPNEQICYSGLCHLL